MKNALIDQTFQILPESLNEMNAYFKVQIYPESPVFRGHFPGNPVMPGVLMLEMVRLSLSGIYSKQCRLVSALNMKFLAVLNPIETPEVKLEVKHQIQDSDLKVEARILLEEKVFYKMKGVYSFEQ